MLAHLLTVVGYIVATALVQGTSHFKINAEHYRVAGFFREAPVVPLGVLAMIVQGLILSLIYASYVSDDTISTALVIAWAFGAFLASYMAFALAGELKVPSIMSWITVELLAAAVQFTLIGVALWAAHHYAGAAVGG
jgi:hypothetical protein